MAANVPRPVDFHGAGAFSLNPTTKHNTMPSPTVSIRWRGKVVEYVEEKITRTVKADDYARELASKVIISSGLLPGPGGCRFWQSNSKRTVYVVEQPPAVRVVRWSPYTSGEILRPDSGPMPQHIYRLAFPWMVFVIRCANGALLNLTQVFCRKQPIVSLEDPLFAPPLTNVGEGYAGDQGTCFFCTGSVTVPVGDNASMVSDLLAKFWNNQFNLDLKENWSWIKDHNEKMSSLDRWQQESDDNPFFVLEASMKKICTLSQAVNAR